MLRSLGKWAALLTLLGDVLKGTAAVAIARVFVSDPGFYASEFGTGILQSITSNPQSTIEGLAGLSAILGHNSRSFSNSEEVRALPQASVF